MDGRTREVELKKMRIPAVIVAMVLAIVTGTSLVAVAHDSSEYYCLDIDDDQPGCKWSVDNRDNVNWKFVNGVPTAMRDRIKDGAQEWNAVTGTDNFRFDWNSGDYSAFAWLNQCPNADSSNYEKNGIHWTSINAAGMAVTCATPGGGLHDFQMVLDSDLDWYSGTGDPPSNKVDTWSTATHEFGHATGWDKHFINNTMCPSNDRPSWQTMCAADSGDLPGARYARTLEAHDIDTFQDAY
jgi:hypothetical protein